MSWRDAITLALKSVNRRIGRALLTVLAVALAAALLSALLVIANTARTKVLNELSSGGPLAGIKVAAAEPDLTEVGSDTPNPGRPRDLDETAKLRISRLRDVVAVLPVIANRVLIVPPPKSAKGRQPTDPFVETAVGVDTARAEELPASLLAGRLPAPGSAVEVAVTQGYLERMDVDVAKAASVIGSELEVGTPRVFSKLGDIAIRGKWTRAVVVGVVAQEAASGQVLVPIEQARAAREWLAQSDRGDESIDTGPSPYSGLFVVARDLDRIERVRAQITAIGYSTSAPENLIAAVQRYLRVVEIVLSGMGAIALVIASLGITNGLLAAVRERRREIGVLKALGARDRDVLRLFLVEAFVLGFLGGVLGVAAGWIMARALTSVVNSYLAAEGLGGVEVGLQLPILAGALVGSSLLALVAGTLPALQAARLPAREVVM